VLAHAPRNHPRAADMLRAIEEAKAAADAGDWLQVGTANMAFHNGVVALSDSVRLMRSFGHVLAELRLAFLKVELLDFLHAPFVERNEEVYETYLGDGPAAASTLLGNYLGDSERQVLGAYARAGQG
ncbi:GntR family transcriptional regulator, partial [Burkholderia multivorans]